MSIPLKSHFNPPSKDIYGCFCPVNVNTIEEPFLILLKSIRTLIRTFFNPSLGTNNCICYNAGNILIAEK